MMIRPFYFLMLCGFTFASEAQQKLQPSITFDESRHDFESVLQGKIVDYLFKFQNIGDQPLIIENVLTSCGCTASEWSKAPIKQGGKGVIKVTFDSTGKIGSQRKVITVVSNATSNRIELIIKAFVLPRRSKF